MDGTHAVGTMVRLLNSIPQWMERAISRVALLVYGTHHTQADIIDIIKRTKAARDPNQYISRGGVPLPGEMGTNKWGTAHKTNP